MGQLLPVWYVNGLTRSFSLESSARSLVLVWTHFLFLAGEILCPSFFLFNGEKFKGEHDSEYLDSSTNQPCKPVYMAASP